MLWVVTAPPPAIELPVRRGAVTVRQGSLEDDLDALHVGDPMWWGKDFTAERIASSPPGTPYTMLVGELDGRPVADAFILGLGIKAQGYAMADLYVLPDARGRGVGRAVRDALTESTRAYGLPGWSTSIPEADQRSVAVAERWGLVWMGHHRESVLELDALDRDTMDEAIRRAEQAGNRLEPLPDDADASAWRAVYDLMMEVWGDAPDAEGATEQMPYEVFRGFFPHPSNVLLAWRGDDRVGLTTVMDRRKDDAVNTFFTGVVRLHRRRPRRAGWRPLDGPQGEARPAAARTGGAPALHAEHGPERGHPGGQRPARVPRRERLLRLRPRGGRGDPLTAAPSGSRHTRR